MCKTINVIIYRHGSVNDLRLTAYRFNDADYNYFKKNNDTFITTKLKTVPHTTKSILVI